MIFFSPDIPLMHGDSTVDVSAHNSVTPSVCLNMDGAVSVTSNLTPANARRLAEQLIAGADYADGVTE